MAWLFHLIAWLNTQPVIEQGTIVMIIAELQLLAIKYKNNSLVTTLIKWLISIFTK
jgi:hypothetical protein